MIKPSGKFATALLMMFALLLIPPTVFTGVALFSDMSMAETTRALIEQYSGRKQNLLVVGIMGCLPLVLLALALWLHRSFKGSPTMRPVLTWSGYFAIYLVMTWVNIEFWSDFLPGRVYPGFPHGLEFVIGPLYFAPMGMAVCMVLAWLAASKSK